MQREHLICMHVYTYGATCTCLPTHLLTHRGLVDLLDAKVVSAVEDEGIRRTLPHHRQRVVEARRRPAVRLRLSVVLDLRCMLCVCVCACVCVCVCVCVSQSVSQSVISQSVSLVPDATSSRQRSRRDPVGRESTSRCHALRAASR